MLSLCMKNTEIDEVHFSVKSEKLKLQKFSQDKNLP